MIRRVADLHCPLCDMDTFEFEIFSIHGQGRVVPVYQATCIECKERLIITPDRVFSYYTGRSEKPEDRLARLFL
jgi:hypothetical protein